MRTVIISILLLGIFRLQAQQVLQTTAIQEPLKTDSVEMVKQWFQEAKNLEIKDTAIAIADFLKAIRCARRQQYYLLEAEICNRFADFWYRHENYQRSFNNFFRARDLYINYIDTDEPALKRQLAKSYIGVAKTQYFRFNYRGSIDSFVETMILAQKNGWKDIEMEAAEYLGLLYYTTLDFLASTNNYYRVLNIRKKSGDAKGAVQTAYKLGKIYYERKIFDSAYYFSDMAYQGAASLSLTTEMYLSRLNKIAALIRLKKNQEAENEFAQFAISPVNIHDVNFSVRYKLLLGNYYLAKGDEAKGKLYYDSALNIANENKFPELYAITYKNMAESYYYAGQFQKSYDFNHLYSIALGEILTGENVRNLVNMEIIFDANLSKAEIKSLSTENKLKKLELLRELEMRKSLEKENRLIDSILKKEKLLSDVLAREGKGLARENAYKSLQLANEKKLHGSESEKLREEKRLRLSLVIGLSTALLMGVIIFLQFNRQKRKNVIIEKQADELETLMKETHHRVKNNLQIISSLLDLQAMSMKDQHASEAVKESKNRVQSMALIHQNLYNEGNIRGIKINSYIRNLADNLFHSYNIEPDRIKMKTDIQELNLDVDTVIPIGLVLNELISNSLKYAFNGKNLGELEVQLKKLEDDTLFLKVKDNGQGFPAGANSFHSNSFGMKMIKAFSQKLKAKLDIYNDNGACVTMHIRKYKLVENVN